MRRKLLMPQPVMRVVSLVPSDTETLCALGLAERLVGRTRYCVEPRKKVLDIAVVGGTKDVDVDAVVSLAPDLVLANQEENSRADLESLAASGVMVFVAFPQRYNDAIAHVARLAKFFGVGAEDAAREILKRGYDLMDPSRELTADAPKIFVPIWRDPLMTFGDHTYCHDLLQLAGGANAFVDRQRQYPLKADLGMRSPLPADQQANRDRRYPRIGEAELVERSPDIILLPDEPYEFGAEDREYFATLDVPAAKSGRIVMVDGKDLFWPGARSVFALPRLRVLLATLGC